ncbi:hypothetical protein CsSME_00051460 [Camellia sinensis var. sinensis]
MATIAAESVSVWTVDSNASFTPKWKASRSVKFNACPFQSATIRASQPMEDKNKVYKELGMFSLRKKIEDAVLRAETLAPTSLELEEASCIKLESQQFSDKDGSVKNAVIGESSSASVSGNVELEGSSKPQEGAADDVSGGKDQEENDKESDAEDLPEGDEDSQRLVWTCGGE